MATTPLVSDTEAWKRLAEHAKSFADGDGAAPELHLRTLLQDSARCAGLAAEFDGILVDFARQRVTLETMDLLFDLAEQAGLWSKIAAMRAGEAVNTTEDRAVMHMALRAPKGQVMATAGADVVPDVHAVLDAIEAYAGAVRAGERKGVTGKVLKNVISVGIGGSYLGPEFVHEALRHDGTAAPAAAGRTLRFLANVDPVDVARATEGLDPAETLVVIVSKTFTTAETMLNARTLRAWLQAGLGAADAVVASHMIALSAAVPKAVDFGIAAANVFGFWDWVGGRYSVCSAVGAMPLALQYGMPTVRSFLAGAHEMDEHFCASANPRANLPVLLGLLGVWNSSFLGFGTRALLPYSQALLRFPAHIQQVDMESNGKRVALDGTPLPFEAGEIDFGEPGTNGQHSFYQLVHQGRVVPCDLVGVCKTQVPAIGAGLAGEPVSNHDELMSNFFAQADALAMGKTVEELAAEGVAPALIPHKEFPGNRPSTSLLLPELDARRVGQLLALYEHRTAVQGAIWGINSFDQWGVELGKVLAKNIIPELSQSETVTNHDSSTNQLINRYRAHRLS
jgi:glucose-6-phosphate isomerase